jgi:hypothetical protein
MNKRIITTSFALVLAMTVVLAVGKTDSTTEPKPSQYIEVAENAPNILVDADIDILSGELDEPASQVRALIIPSEVNESELILKPEAILGFQSDVTPTSPLLGSLARVQQALDRLERVAASTELAVAALEHKTVIRE